MANPGCYATAAILAAAPLVRRKNGWQAFPFLTANLGFLVRGKNCQIPVIL